MFCLLRVFLTAYWLLYASFSRIASFSFSTNGLGGNYFQTSDDCLMSWWLYLHNQSAASRLFVSDWPRDGGWKPQCFCHCHYRERLKKERVKHLAFVALQRLSGQQFWPLGLATIRFGYGRLPFLVNGISIPYLAPSYLSLMVRKQ